MPTYERTARFVREFRRLPAAKQAAFLAALRQFVTALRADPPAFPVGLRVKRVQGTDDVWEMAWAPDGRATFAYGDEQLPGEPHVIWRRIGSHSILRDP